VTKRGLEIIVVPFTALPRIVIGHELGDTLPVCGSIPPDKIQEMIIFFRREFEFQDAPHEAKAGLSSPIGMRIGLRVCCALEYSIRHRTK
jgi:hypothetical protein